MNEIQKLSKGLACPECRSYKSSVVDKNNYEDTIYRRRECNNGHRYTTNEKIVTKEEADAKLKKVKFAPKKIIQPTIDYKKAISAFHDLDKQGKI